MIPSRNTLVLALILFAGLVVRLHHFTYPPIDYHNWRQTQTLMIARNFAEGSMNLFRPAVDWRTTDGPVDNGTVGGTELQIMPWLTALLYRLFGFRDWVGRVVPIFFSLLGLACFHRLVARFFTPLCAHLSTLLLCVSPMVLFFGRVQMPESFTFALYFAALLFFDRWLCERKRFDYTLATLACLLAILAKPQMSLMLLPLLFLCFLRLGWRFLLEWRLYLMACAVAGPFLLFTWYSNSVLIAETGLSFAQPNLLNFGLVKTLAYHQRIWERVLHIVLGPALIALALLGMLRPFKGKGGWLPYVWAVAAVLFFLLLPGGNNANSYYQMVLAPPACIFAARLLEPLFTRRFLIPIGVVVTAFVCVRSLDIARDFFNHRESTAHYACGRWVDEHLPQDALVLTSTDNPATLYFSDRKGWICWLEHYGKPIRFDEALIEQVKAKGATAIAIPDGQNFYHPDRKPNSPYKGLRDMLYANYACHREEDFLVFLLNEPSNAGTPPAPPKAAE